MHKKKNDYLIEKYIRPSRAEKKMKIAKSTNTIVYIAGVCGTGKTAFVNDYFKNKKHEYYKAEDLNGTESFEDEEGKIIVIDNLQWAEREEIREGILKLLEMKKTWLILIGRSRMPSWMIASFVEKNIMIIEEEDLRMGEKEIYQYFESCEIDAQKDIVDTISKETYGNAMAVRMAVKELRSQKGFNEDILKHGYDMFCNYLNRYVYDKWDPDIQEFVMKTSIVDKFDIQLAELITGRTNAERLLVMAEDIGGFVRKKGDEYEYLVPLRKSMIMRLKTTYEKEQIDILYDHAGLYYELNEQFTKALEMYKICGNEQGISNILIKNAKLNPGNSYIYELRKYYYGLSEKEIKKNVYLMAGISMLYSLQMNIEESERWYLEVKEYEKRQSGALKKIAKGWMTYLEIALPHKGIKNIVDVIKSAALLKMEKNISVPEMSVTSNLPSIMNGGKDFCEWSKHDRELARTIGTALSLVLGKYGKGLIDTALAESFFEKGEDRTEIVLRASRAQIQCEAGGKLEMYFVNLAILARVYLIDGKLEDAFSLVDAFYKKLENSSSDRMKKNLEAFETRLLLYQPEAGKINTWFQKAPNEEEDFYVLERYCYTTKIRIYILYEKYNQAVSLLEKLLYFADVNDRPYTRMECHMLLAMIYYRKKDSSYRQLFQEVLKEAGSYHFIRIISREGIAVLNMLKECLNGMSKKWKDSNREYMESLLKETEKMAVLYPSYLNTSAIEQDVFSKNAIWILKYQSEGKSYADISEILGIKESTVKYHCIQTYRKLGVKGKAAAVAEAKRRGLI